MKLPVAIIFKTDYNPTLWEDEIIDIDDMGKPKPLLDENGKVVLDIFGNTIYETIQDGTRITEKIMNNIEDGILNAHKWLLNNTNQKSDRSHVVL